MIKRPSLKQFSLTYASLADQGMVSLGNFLTQIILARKLAPGDYGIFALLFGVLFIMNVCHWALVAYPLSVRGAQADEATLRRVTSDSLLLTAFLEIPLCSIAIGTTLILKRPALIPWVALALLAWQLQETVRRGLMAHLRHSSAIFGDVLSYLGQSVALLVLSALGHLSLSSVFAAIALTSAIAGIVQAVQLGFSIPRVRETVELIPLYWRIGKWALVANTADASLLQTLPWVLAVSHGLEYASSFQAALNILNITNPVMSGVANVVVPACLREDPGNGPREGWRVALRYAKWGFVALIPYYAVLLIWPHKILVAYYGPFSHYNNLDGPLRILVPAFVIAYPFAVIAAFFNGVQRPAFVFGAELAGVVALVFGIYLSWRLAVTGACLALLFVCMARTTAGILFLKRMLRADTRNKNLKAKGLQSPQSVPITPMEDLSQS